MRHALFAAALFSIVSIASAHAQSAPSDIPTYASDPKFVSAMAEGKDLERKRQYNFALDAYKKASKIAGGSCEQCLKKVYKLETELGDFKAAIATAQQLVAIAPTPRAKSLAESDLGTAILAKAGEKPKPDQLDQAHKAYQAALTDYEKNIQARYDDACVLTRLGKKDDASKAFSVCAEALSPTDPMRLRAEHFAENPELSMAKLAPPFEVKTIDGTKFNLDDMQGRVVLIDFWATWCGPCNEELPHLARIVKEFAEQPLVVISISADSNEAKWKEFVAKHNMTWVQYRDADGSIAKRFNNNLLPSYYMIGSDGVMVSYSRMGADADIEGRLKKLLKQAREAQSRTTAGLQTRSN